MEQQLAGQNLLNPSEVASYFLSKSEPGSPTEITPLKLQKLVYYAQAWHLALTDGEIVDCDFEAWIHGPVCRELYSEYRHHGFDVIPKPLFSDNTRVNGKSKQLLDKVWNLYGDKSPKHLEQLTHREKPWKEARKGKEPHERASNNISNDTMREYYRKLLQKVAK
ncbi:Panacea domain-containing protein [Thalassobacillus sp. CUG 92003]|uniref:Panacea domain-containing protein n=1 Tax=Thalassobacillus sp. CUG 92003 TaxID=2736641 RepID=UPI0015E68BA4|nr:type II toxin-antitoxin system antitoxin SocA domain-containing protein [Thalassobacillus sp. CUG 92003]